MESCTKYILISFNILFFFAFEFLLVCRFYVLIYLDLTFTPFAEEKMALTLKELKEERDAIASLLPRD